MCIEIVCILSNSVLIRCICSNYSQEEQEILENKISQCMMRCELGKTKNTLCVETKKEKEMNVDQEMNNSDDEYSSRQ